MLALMFSQSPLITLRGLKWLRTFQGAVQMLLTARSTEREAVKVMFVPWKLEDVFDSDIVHYKYLVVMVYVIVSI